MGRTTEMFFEKQFDEWLDSQGYEDWEFPYTDSDFHYDQDLLLEKLYNERYLKDAFDERCLKYAYDFHDEDERTSQSFTNYIIKAVGVTFGNRQSVIKRLHRGDILQFVPEPDNAYDKNAIKILTASGEQIGYVSKDYNSNILRQLQCKKIAKVQVLDVTGDLYETKGVNIIVYLK